MSIRKISNELGLSIATVSWILSGQGEQRGFKEETIKRVTEYAKERNYSPNLVARNLSKGSTKTLGVIIPHLSDPYFASIAQEIETQAHQRSYGLTICSSAGEQKREEELIELLLNQQIDGLIIAPAGSTDKSIKRLKAKECPFVLIDRHSTTNETNYVGSNNFQCSFDLTVKMILQGAKKIALVTSDSHLSAMEERLNGYISALESHNLKLNRSLIIDIDRLNYKDQSGIMIEKLLSNHPDIDGFFFTTHYLALNAIKHFTEHGLDYNSRFKMASIYNSTWLKLLAPNINIASVPIKEIGCQAVEILCNSINNKKLPLSQIVLDNTII